MNRRHFLSSILAVLAAPRLLPAPGAGVAASAPGPAPVLVAGESARVLNAQWDMAIRSVEDIHGVFLSSKGYWEKIS